MEQKNIQEAFGANWVVPLGPNVNGSEKDLKDSFNGADSSAMPQNDKVLTKRAVALLSGTAAVHLGLLA